MRKIFYLLIAAAFVSGSAYADFVDNTPVPAQGFVDNGAYSAAPSLSSIKDVANMYDDQITIVRGKITKRISDDKYIFKDETGEMVVEIDYKYWAGIQVTPQDTIELTGKVDRDYNSVSLDVFAVKKVK